MPIFPQTFTDDKPIYYPTTWKTGKTAPQLFEQWKQTTEFFILTNVLQCMIAGLWVWFIFVVCSAIYQMWKLDDQNRNKIANRQFISKKFVFSISFISLIVFGITITLILMDQFTRFALVKGYFFYIFVKWSRMLYKKGKQSYLEWKKNRNKYKKVKDDQDQQDD